MRLYLGDPISELCRSNDTTRESEHVHAAAASTRKVAVIDFVSQPSPAISNPKVTAVAGRLGRRSKVEILSRKSPAICVVATSQLGDRVRFSREKSEMQSHDMVSVASFVTDPFPGWGGEFCDRPFFGMGWRVL